MQRQGRHVPLPAAMQGRWTDLEDPTSELIVRGGEVTCFGQPVTYDYKTIDSADGALSVCFRIDDEANEDAFQRRNITAMVISPEGDLHAYNVKFASQFVRPKP